MNYIENPSRFATGYLCQEHFVAFEIRCFECVREIMRKIPDHNSDEYWNAIAAITLDDSEKQELLKLVKI